MKVLVLIPVLPHADQPVDRVPGVQRRHGMKMAEASVQYRHVLIGEPNNVQLRLCEFTRERQTRDREPACALRFANFGNTCWLNAVSHLFRATGMAHLLPAAMRAFIENGTRVQAQVATAALGMRFGMQHDAHEAVIFILEHATQGLRDALAVRLRTVREARGYRAANIVIEHVLSVAIEDATVQGILRSMQARRTVEAPLAGHNVHTETVTVLPHPPRFLIIALKRYAMQPRGGGVRKIRDAVEADQVITLAGTTLYLRAIIVHLGSTPRSGHYVAHVRDAAGWMRFDDSIVTQSPGPDSDEVRRDAYILLYGPA